MFLPWDGITAQKEPNVAISNVLKSWPFNAFVNGFQLSYTRPHCREESNIAQYMKTGSQ